MANYKTGAQRYNDRMDKIWETAKAIGTGIFNYKDKCKICHKNKMVDINGECKQCYNSMKKFRGIN